MKLFKKIFSKNEKEDRRVDRVVRIDHDMSDPGEPISRSSSRGEVVADSYEAYQNTPFRFLLKLIYKILYFRDFKFDSLASDTFIEECRVRVFNCDSETNYFIETYIQRLPHLKMIIYELATGFCILHQTRGNPSLYKSTFFSENPNEKSPFPEFCIDLDDIIVFKK
jgi:hypothetical protein